MANENTNNGATPLPDASVKADAQPPSAVATDATPASNPPPEKRWPGWSGDSVFRLVVPVSKIESIIGKKGELIKRICEETKARIRVLDGVQATTDRIVLISGKEEPEARLSPAMSAVLRVFKRINGLPETESEGTDTGLRSYSQLGNPAYPSSAYSTHGLGGYGSGLGGYSNYRL